MCIRDSFIPKRLQKKQNTSIFLNYNCHQNIFALEVESDSSMSILDILLNNNTNSSLNTSVFHKITFPGFTLNGVVHRGLISSTALFLTVIGKFVHLEICLILESEFTP